MMTAPVTHAVVSAERPVIWKPAEMSLTPWTVEVRMLVQSSDTLLLDVEVTTSRERTVERWQVVFHGMAALKQESVGSPDNPHLTRYDWRMRLAAPPTAFWIIDHSEWLP